MTDDSYTFDLATGRLTKAVPQPAAADFRLTSEWCDSTHVNDFHSYPQDGECECGLWKHHVHGVCGHVIQVG